jgi:YIF1
VESLFLKVIEKSFQTKMRKARRTAEQQDMSTPYPQYGYPPGPMQPETTMPMYNNMGGGPMYNQPPNYYPQTSAPPMGTDQFYPNPAQLLQNPAVANLAMQYVPNLMNQGKEVLDREMNKYISASRLKYYFSVDTAYVAKKLGLVIFPFTHQVYFHVKQNHFRFLLIIFFS